MSKGLDLQKRLVTPVSVNFCKATGHLRRTIEAGVTTVRDADWLQHGVPILHIHFENDPEVQWLRRRINGEPILPFPTSPP